MLPVGFWGEVGGLHARPWSWLSLGPFTSCVILDCLTFLNSHGALGTINEMMFVTVLLLININKRRANVP